MSETRLPSACVLPAVVVQMVDESVVIQWAKLSYIVLVTYSGSKKWPNDVPSGAMHRSLSTGLSHPALYTIR